MEFKRHFDREDVERLFERFSLPEGFMFGVANAAYQVEGGYNGPGQPRNNWAGYEESGRAERTGEAVRFWTDYPQQLELAAGMGLNGFRISLEWARVQPSTSPGRSGAPPAFDRASIEAYSDMIAAIMKAGMEPVVTLHHFTHPEWLGKDFWLDSDLHGLFCDYVAEAARSLGGLLVEKHSLRPVRYWVTINEPNVYALLTYALRYFPHARAGIGATAECWSNMLAAHCRAYDTIHGTYEEQCWDSPLVGFNTFNWSTYHMDKIMTDILLARRNGVERSDLPAYVENGKREWDAEISRCPEVRRAPWLYVKLEELLDPLTSRVFSLERLARGVDEVYASPLDDKLDYLAIDYYDAFFRYHPRVPSPRDIRERRFAPNAELWEQVLNPGALYHFIKGYAINGRGLPLLVLESGMCHRVHRGLVEPRHDGATRDTFLQSYLYEVLRAAADGVPVTGYFHWTLVDNYEWGSYEPRFGLFTVDRSRSPVKIRSVDAWGVNAARVYGELIQATRAADPRRIADAFCRDHW